MARSPLVPIAGVDAGALAGTATLVLPLALVLRLMLLLLVDNTFQVQIASVIGNSTAARSHMGLFGTHEVEEALNPEEIYTIYVGHMDRT